MIMHVGRKQTARTFLQQVNVVHEIDFSLEKCVGTRISKQQMNNDNGVWPKHFPWLNKKFSRKYRFIKKLHCQ